jgi:ankyrin repeat protein
MNAAMLGRLDVVRALIDNGANVQKKGQFGYTALHAAAQGGHLEVVQALVNYGASVNCKNDDGDIPLILGESVDDEDWSNECRLGCSCARDACRDHRLSPQIGLGYSSKRLARTIGRTHSE